MRSLVTCVAGTLVVVALAVVPRAAAQDRGGTGGGGHSAGGAGTAGGGGHSAGAPGGGGGSSSSGGSSGSSSGGFSGGSSSGSSGGSSGASSGGGFSAGGGAGRARGYAGPSPMGMGAGPRNMGNGRTGGPDAGTAVTRGSGRALASDPADRSIPAGSRPNYGNPVVGSAVERGTAKPGTGGGTGSYSPNAYWYNNPYWADWLNLNYGASAWGLGARNYGYYGSLSNYNSPWARCSYYYGCDPFYLYGYGTWGLGEMYGDPFWSGMTSGYGGGYSGGGYSSDRSSQQPSQPLGARGGLKLKVSPSQAEVYVDGYYIGKVDDYNGAFQRLELPVGTHQVELRAKGYQPINFEVNIEPRDTLAYRGTMQPLQPVVK